MREHDGTSKAIALNEHLYAYWCWIRNSQVEIMQIFGVGCFECTETETEWQRETLNKSECWLLFASCVADLHSFCLCTHVYILLAFRSRSLNEISAKKTRERKHFARTIRLGLKKWGETMDQQERWNLFFKHSFLRPFRKNARKKTRTKNIYDLLCM